MTITTIAQPDLAALATIAPLTPEHYSDVRALHRLAIRTSGWRFYSLREVGAKIDEIDGADYTLRLMREHGLAARICGTLVATAFWSAADDDNRTAVISDLYVHPAFEGGDIATRLVHAIESSAFAAGCRRMRVRASLDSRGLYAQLGYERESFELYYIASNVCFPLQVLTRGL